MLLSDVKTMGDADGSDSGSASEGYEIEYVSKSGRTRELNQD